MTRRIILVCLLAAGLLAPVLVRAEQRAAGGRRISRNFNAGPQRA